MSQLLKKYALLAACAVLALCFATRPAHAQSVADGGTGEHLIFGYWSTANYMNTNVNVHSPSGVRTSNETKNVVRVVIRDDMGEAAADFKVCLTPGDSWTATLSMGGLMVMDPGECDDDVQQSAADRDNIPNETPAMGEMLSLGDVDGGYLEAWAAPLGGLVDDTVPCVAPADPIGPGECATAQGVGGGDADLAADNATARDISGSAMLVSAASGFSSSYTPTALMNCGNQETDGTGVTIRAAIAAGTEGGDDGNGCWHVQHDNATPFGASDVAGMPIMMALADGKELLTGRWTAINDDNVMSHTKVVLTLPMNHLNYEGKSGAINSTVLADPGQLAAIDDVEGTDPVSILVFDDTGSIVGSGHEVMLGMNVNMCLFMSAGMDMMDGMPMLSCNGEMVSELDGMSGEFRVYNNVAENVATPDPDNAGQYLLADTFSDGTEMEGIGAEMGGNLVDSDSATAGDQIPQMPAETLGAIGLVFSYFMGTDGMQYDQATSIQSIELPEDDSDTANVNEEREAL